MGIVLKPCPFCGASDPKLIDSIAERRWRVDCQDCTASVSTAFRDATIALWNKRVEVPAPADPFVPDAEVRAALSLLIDAGNLMGAEGGEHFRTAARTVHAWLYSAAQ